MTVPLVTVTGEANAQSMALIKLILAVLEMVAAGFTRATSMCVRAATVVRPSRRKWRSPGLWSACCFETHHC